LKSFFLSRVWVGRRPSPTLWLSVPSLATIGSLPFCKHTGGGVPHQPCLFTICVGSTPTPISSGAFHRTATVTSFLHSKHTGGGEGVPLPNSLELRAPRPLCYLSCCCCLFSLFFFSFFPGWGSVCPGGYADLVQGCLWKYHTPLSSPGGLLLSSRLGAGVWRCGSPPGFSV
jgi:hypothetical protein